MRTYPHVGSALLLLALACAPAPEDPSLPLDTAAPPPPLPTLLLADDPILLGLPHEFRISGLQPGQTAWLAARLAAGDGPVCFARPTMCLDLEGPYRSLYTLGAALADHDGVATITVAIPAALPAGPLRLQALANPGASYAVSNVLDARVLTQLGDADRDGLTNLAEREAGTDPELADTDGGGVSDGDEVEVWGTDPLRADDDPRDADQDGHPAGPDCDDANDAVHPGAAELCNDADDDCDGLVDDGVAALWYADDDADGYGDAATAIPACTQPVGAVDNADDCDDSAADIRPGAEEQCNSADDDCDGVIDEDGALAWYPDADLDGWGGGQPIYACAPPAGYVATLGDCDDAQATVHPGAAERCNDADDDCDTLIDDGAQLVWYLDGDGDGWGGGVATAACTQPSGYVAAPGDCNDATPAANPAAPEICDGLDNDCEGGVDEGVQSTFFQDLDGDGWGNSWTVLACQRPAGHTPTPGDCDDGRGNVHPGHGEICDGLDNDCEGGVDEGVQSTFFQDLDGDGWGNSWTVLACQRPAGHTPTPGDCDDGRANVNPGHGEVCDGLDNDCEGGVDEGVLTRWYRDRDGDTFGDPGVSVQACSAPAGYVSDRRDCYDRSSLIRPGIVMVGLRRMYSPTRSDHMLVKDGYPEMAVAQQAAHGSYRVESIVGYSIVQWSGVNSPPAGEAVVPVNRWWKNPDDHAFSPDASPPQGAPGGYVLEDAWGWVARDDVENADPADNITRRFYQSYHAGSSDHMMLNATGETPESMRALGWADSEQVGFVFTRDMTCAP